jgi:N-acetylneuraminate synthase
MDEVVGVKTGRDIFAGDFITEDDLASDDIFTRFDAKKIPWKWGVVTRFHDFKPYLPYRPRVIEFHLSDKDLEEEVPQGSFSQELVVHAPEYMKRHYLNPAAENRDERKLAIVTLRKSLEVTKQVAESFQGVPKFIVHPGGITLQPSSHPERLLEIFADTLSQIATEGVEILPENLPPRPWVFGGEWITNIFLRSKEIKDFLDGTGRKMCFDTSHAGLGCAVTGEDLIEMITFLRPYIRHLHVADGAGVGDEGLQIGEGTIDWSRVMAALAGYEHTMVPEIWQGHLHGGRGFLQALMRLAPHMR